MLIQEQQKAESSYLAHRVALFKAMKTRQDFAKLLWDGYKNYGNYIFFIFEKGADQQYTEFNIAKGNNKKRTIAAPDNRLKQIQKKIADILLSIYEPKKCVHAFVKNKNIVSNARPHLKSRHVLRLDIKDFFPSIHFGRVRNLFEASPFNFSREISTAIAIICCYKGSLPQGAPTSPIISNMICLRMDAQLSRLAEDNFCSYTRYADDITFSTKSKFFSKRIVFSISPLMLSCNIIKIIEDYNYFKINNDKTNIRSPGDSKFITGVKVNSKLNVARKKYREIRAMLHAVIAYGHDNALKEHISKFSRSKLFPPTNFYEIIQGKIAFLGMVRGNIDPLVSKLKMQLAHIRKFAHIQKFDEMLIKYVEECGYSTTKVNGRKYIFLNIYKNNKKIGLIRQNNTSGAIETSLRQFTNESIKYIKPKPYAKYAYENNGLRWSLRGCEDSFGRIYLEDGVYL
ncbi:MAG: reverse transcriptase family protein [Holophagaceae bacterium]|nr:reverse transcriptase family protein [Holophagaceae bacterium]